ncbi:MAG: hypothetical protein ACRC2K_06375, partial [Clostridium sp.]
SLTMNFMPVQDEGRPLQGGELTNVQLQEVNKDIKLFISNWEETTGGTGVANDSYIFIEDGYTIE